MIIGHVNLARGFRGGERQTELLIRELSARGYEQVLIARKGSALSPRLDGLPGLTIREIAKPFLLHTGAARGCDLLHAHEAKAAQYALLVRKFRGIPYVITRRVPKVPKQNFFTRAVYRNAAQVTALSGAIRDNLLKLQPTLKITIIPSMASPLQSDELNVATLRQRFSGKFVVGHIGALVNYHKGQQYLIEAARELRESYPDIQIVFLGEGRDETWFREMSQGLDNVSFEGFVNNVGDYLALFDLFAFPSLQEGLGSILIDAMNATLPIVASDVDGIPDLIKHEKNGLLVPPADSVALSAAIVRLYENKGLRDTLSSQAKDDSQIFFPPMITSRYLQEIYPVVMGQ
jgi:glycosyltransferase involved in cell wall biosynthesis